MADEKVSQAGGCLCGAVRYEGEDLQSLVYCHCTMCQKATGGAFALFSQCEKERFRITKGEPKWYPSSEALERGFCQDCGTPLFIRALASESSNWIMPSVGSLDHPERITPERHYGIESQLPWLEFHDGLPREAYPERFLEKPVEKAKANPDAPLSGWRADSNGLPD